jgi:hypothetical protein
LKVQSCHVVELPTGKQPWIPLTLDPDRLWNQKNFSIIHRLFSHRPSRGLHDANRVAGGAFTVVFLPVTKIFFRSKPDAAVG